MRFLKIFLFCLGMIVLPAMAELKIDVSGAQSEPTPIALPEFYAVNTALDKSANQRPERQNIPYVSVADTHSCQYGR